MKISIDSLIFLQVLSNQPRRNYFQNQTIQKDYRSRKEAQKSIRVQKKKNSKINQIKNFSSIIQKVTIQIERDREKHKP